MVSLRSFTALSIASISFLPFTAEVKSDDYGKGFYASISGGVGTFSDLLYEGTPLEFAFDTGFSYEGSLGYDFGKYLRAEVSYANTTSSIENNHNSAALTNHDATFGSLTINGYLDFPIGETKFTPFIGAGYGSTNVDVVNLCSTGGTDTCTDDVATYSLSAGLSYALNSDTEIIGKITYLGFDDITVTDDGTVTTVTETETGSAQIGVRFKF